MLVQPNIAHACSARLVGQTLRLKTRMSGK